MLSNERKSEIESEVRKLQISMWHARGKLLPDHHPEHVSPLKLFEPSLAAKHLGLHFESYPTLGDFGGQNDRHTLAGFLNRDKKQMGVSQRFSMEVQRFTAAHELGHYKLHPDQMAFRDRPIGGLNTHACRSSIEAEADYFAACFLMPRNLVIERFSQIFGTKHPIIINDALAWHLVGNNFSELLNAPIDSLVREKAIARCDHIGTDYFASLAEQFHVSVESMAIRIKELRLIAA